MRYSFLLLILLISCADLDRTAPFQSVSVTDVYTDSLSIRAIELMGNSLAFAANKGTFGTVDLASGKVRSKVEKYHTQIPEFRSVSHNATVFFMLSVANPALLYNCIAWYNALSGRLLRQPGSDEHPGPVAFHSP